MEEIIKRLLSREKFNIDDLVDLVIVLRSENGCPWDKVQTHKSIKKDFLEEVYEVMEAIDCESPEMMREELGDVLLQVVFHTVIEQENDNFQLDDVITELCQKLIVRHPHVFGDVKANTVDKVLTNWDAIKKETKGQESYTDTLRSVPKNFPALMRAQKLGKRANRAGIDFPKEDSQQTELIGDIQAVLNKIESDISQSADSSEDIGNLLFLCANLARRCGCDAEEVLTEASNKFIQRFEELENSGEELSKLGAKDLYAF